ncbi:MAG TPA: PaaI family thioesterase [Myxococcales bacterium]|nr:PaaI family thioesterase [Myxococcales bacterium]
MKSLQDTYGPGVICFGCGPANAKGLRIKSFPQGEECVAEYRVEKHHQAFPGVVNGGIIGTLFDCHCNWTATWAIMRKRGADAPPCTVTADFHVFLKRPTPCDALLRIRAWPAQVSEDRAVIESTLEANGKVCATCTGTFVAVKEGHPAFHRW